ncbi:hypothetical protein JN535_14495, partial [Cellulosimicrobium cellulans]|uniref:hypothetical protein n=1 Tax=Cellulosimicrobium cellulans TaxID=1710 RepID=UPI001D4E8C84|nr:hypothetical protein [Cellulosimicrobium cellulans]
RQFHSTAGGPLALPTQISASHSLDQRARSVHLAVGPMASPRRGKKNAVVIGAIVGLLILGGGGAALAVNAANERASERAAEAAAEQKAEEEAAAEAAAAEAEAAQRAADDAERAQRGTSVDEIEGSVKSMAEVT